MVVYGFLVNLFHMMVYGFLVNLFHMVVYLVNLVLAIWVNLVNVVHLVHLADWILDNWVKLDMFYYPKDEKIFQKLKFSSKF